MSVELPAIVLEPLRPPSNTKLSSVELFKLEAAVMN